MLPDIDTNAYDEWEKQQLAQQMDQKVSSFTLEHALDSRISELSAFSAPASSDSLTNPLGTGNAQPAPEPAVQPAEQLPSPPAPDLPTPPLAPPAPRAIPQPQQAPEPAVPDGMDSWIGGALGAVRRAGGDAQKFADGLNTGSADLVGNALGAAKRSGADLQAFAASLPPPPAPPTPAGRASAPGGGASVGSVPGWLSDLISRNAPPELASDPEFIRTVAAGAKAESGWDVNRVQNGFSLGSGGGARGLFQFDMGGMGSGFRGNEQALLGQEGAEMQASKIVPLYAKAYQSAPTGMSGADRASWVAAQAERPAGFTDPASAARRNYASAFDEIGGAIQGAASAVGGAVRGAVNQISQFGDKQLSSDEAYAACGPAAAVRFASAYGRNPSLREATDLAKQVGWTPGSGMAGLSSEKALMDKIGVPTKMVAGAQWDQFAQEAQSGNPVTISTPGHYFFADGFDPTSGAFHVGQSGTDLKGGSEWMTPAQMEARMGKVQGGLLADNPQVPAPSIADRDTDPVSYLGRLKDTVGSSITSGAPAPNLTDINGRLTPEATGASYQMASVGEPTALQAPAPEASPVDRLKNAFGDFVDSIGGGAKSATDALGATTGGLVASPGGGLPGGSQPLPSDSLTNPIGTRYPSDPDTEPTGPAGALHRLGQGLPDITGLLDVDKVPAVPFLGEGGAQSPVGRIAQGQTLSPTEQLQAFPQELIAMSTAHDEAAKALDPLRDVPIVGSVLEQATNPLSWVGASGAKGFAGAAGALASSAAAARLTESLVADDDPNREAKIALATLVGGLPGAAAGERLVQPGTLDAAFEAIDRARPPSEAYASTTPPPGAPGAAGVPTPPAPPTGGAGAGAGGAGAGGAGTPVPGPPTPPAPAPSRLREIRDMFERQDRRPSLLARVGEQTADLLGLGGRTGTLDTAVADRFAAINQMTGRAREALGSHFTPEMDAEAHAATFMGRGGRAKQLIEDEVTPALDVVRPRNGTNDVENLNVYRKAQRDMEVANMRGGTRTASAGVDSAATAQATLDELEGEVGRTRWQAIERADTMLNQAQERLLERRVDAGLIDRDLADELIRLHPHYNPTVVMKYVDDGGGVGTGGSTMQTATNKVRQLAEDGSKDDTEKPIRSLIRHFVENDVLINRNETAQSILAAAQADPTMAALVRKVPPMRRVTGPSAAGPGGPAAAPGSIASVMTRRFGDQPGEMSVYERGVRNYYSIPEGLEAAVKGLDAETSNTFQRIMARTNAPLRFGATAGNPRFALVTNPLSDAVTTYLREGARTTAGIPKGWWAAATKNDLYKHYLREGGSMESLFQRSPQDLDKLVEQTGGVSVHSPHDITRLTKDALGLQWLRRAGEVVEMGPKLSAFERHLLGGESGRQAAMAGRRATVDFARGGDAIRQANAVSLFLNARVQGTLNMARTLRDEPASRARLAALAAMTAGAYAYNRQFPEYKDVPREVRDNSMVFMMPGSEKNPDGVGYKRLNYISVPLREWSVFTAPVNYMLSQIDKEQGDDPRTWQDFAKSEASTLSPVSGDDTGTGVSGLLPAPGRYAVENATNTRIRSGAPIIPTRYQGLPPSQQWDERTSRLGRKLGETLGISPMGFDFAVNENLGGLGRVALDTTNEATDRVTRALGGEVPTTGQETAPVLGGLLSGAVRTYGGQIARDRYDKLDQLVGQFQEPVATSVRQDPEYASATRDRQDEMVRVAQQQMKEVLQDELGIQSTSRDLGLPNKYSGVVDDPQYEREIDSAVSKYNAWTQDPRNNQRPDSNAQRLALRYMDLVNPRYTLERQRMEQRNAGLRAQAEDTLATARGR